MAAYTNFVKELFHLNAIQPFQTETLDCLLGNRDVFLSVKTGGGKSLCYQAFHPIWTTMNNGSCTVLIVTPLISIMREQCDYLNSVGRKATYIGKDPQEDDDIMSGTYNYVFASPEQLLSTCKWRESLLSKNIVKLLVIDEAHTVQHWGEAEDGETAFRSWFGKLGELRSLLECPVLLMTATANKTTRRNLQRKFCMEACKEILDNPDRPNIKLFVAKTKSNEPLSVTFQFLLNMLKEKRQECDRVIVFCQSIKHCSDIFTMLRLELADEIEHVQMYHSSTTESVKDMIKTDLSNPSGHIRILIATSAAGMGVNFSNITTVVNYGPPKDMDSFIQQFGRAGRDGTQATALLLYNPRQCRNLDPEMTEYINNTSTCRRKILLSFYNANCPSIVRHACCDICAVNCPCASDCPNIEHPFFLCKIEYSSESELSDTLEEQLDISN